MGALRTATSVRGRSAALLTIVALLGALLAAASPAAAAADDRLPIVFVHGGAGSGAQYQTQAMRFDSNGYPAELISAFEYNSASPLAIAAAPTQLNNHIDAVRAEHGVEQVHLVGHSLGTFVSSLYLGQPARAAKVASYVGVDGQGGATCPGGVPCIGIWANTTGNLGGNNVHLPDQTHVEVATSEASFAAQYGFFTGEAPATTLVLPEPPGQVAIAGRAVDFPANAGTAGATLRIWEVERQTGERKYAEPVATFELDSSGAWGPVKVNGQQHYEFELEREGLATAHKYAQPFIRSSHLVRVLATPVGSAIAANTNAGDGHAAAVVIREREWWGSREPMDQLWVGTRSASGNVDAIDVLANVTANNAIGIHLHDAAATPGESTGELLPFFPTQAFQTGVDVFMPANDPPDGTISFVSIPRGDMSSPQVVNVPNWASSEHRINVRFNDYVQDITSWGECMRQRPSPCR
jgi:pimeloyl-ACP methyl ester carboxylesterase